MREFCQQKRSNNTSGVPGVHFLRLKNQPKGIWQARIKLADGRKIHKTFSVSTKNDAPGLNRPGTVAPARLPSL